MPRFRDLRAAILAGTLLGLAGFAEPAEAGGPESRPAPNVPEPAVFAPNTTLEFHVPRCDDQIRVDGRLEESAWRTAARLENFVEVDPGDNVEPDAETEVYVTYDDDNVYFGFVCHDDDPAKIRATITDRDNIYRDDMIGVMLDTFGDQQNAYEFFVNPYGIQADLRRTRNNEDDSYDTVWYSGGHLNGRGWTAEMAIPFRSIRFPDAESQTWGIHVLRIRPRDSREQMSWAPISRDESCLFCQAGSMNGMVGVNQGKNLEVLPYVIASQSSTLEGEDDASFDWTNDKATGDAGVGLKYGITPNYTLDATYNPDFSQIESDASQIDANQTFALFFPEKRPFFLEGADMFNTKIRGLYTRSINDPRAAAKITGKQGANTIGVISALDERSPYIVPFEEQSEFVQGGKSYSTVVRGKRDVLEESFLGVLVTDRRMTDGNGSNTTYGVDTRLRLSEIYGFEAQVLGSYTRERDDTTLSVDFDDIRFGKDQQYTSFFDGEEFGGYAMSLSLNRNARHYNFWAWYDDFSPTFRAENGFVTSNNYRAGGIWSGYTFYIEESSILDRVEPQIDLGQKYNHDGLFKDEWLSPSVWIRFKKQTSMWTGYLWSSERFAGSHIEGIRRWNGNVNSNFSRLMTAGFYWSLGQSIVRDRDDPRLGNQRTFEVWTTLKPLSQLQLDLNYTSFHLDELESREEIYDVFVTRARLQYQFSKSLFLRLIGEYVDADNFATLDPLLSYKINPFTVFFIGSSHTWQNIQDDPDTPGVEVVDPHYRQTDRIFFMKFQYLFRV
jgi:hypothetical protein